MGPVRRVIIRDKQPWFEPRILDGRSNRAVLLAAVVSLLIQLVALIQVLQGQGKKVGVVDHVSFAVVALLWLTLGVLVFLQRRNQGAGQLFLLSAVAGSAFLSLGTLWSVSFVDALIFAAGLLFFAPLLFSFTRAFSGERRWQWRDLLLYVPALLVIWPGAQDLLLPTPAGLPWRLGTVSVAVYLLGAIIQAWNDRRSSRIPARAAQVRALFVGLVAGTVPGVPMFVVPLVVRGHLGVALSFLPVFILVFLIAMSYAILLFEFSEADLSVRRSVVYGMLTLVVVVAYSVLGVVLAASSSSITSVGGGLGLVAVTVLIGAAFTPLRHAAHRLADWVLYGRRTDRWELLEALGQRLATVLHPEELGDVLVGEITRALHLRGAFLLRRMDADELELRHRAANARMAAPDYGPATLCLAIDRAQEVLGSPPAPVLLVHARPLTPAGCQAVPERFKALDEARVALAVPLVTHARLEAVLCLRPKLAHDAFDSDDMALLAPVVRQATAALENALLFSRLQETVEELREASRRIAQEQERERTRLARELHDGTAQQLAGLITLATVAERQLEGRPDPVRGTLWKIRGLAEEAYQEVRRSSHALRPLMLDDLGLVPTLTHYLDEFEQTTKITVGRTVDEVGGLPSDVELTLFRVAQECMENVRKHSGSRRASLLLHRANGHVMLAVADAGRGMQAEGDHGIGLATMRERVSAVGGTIRVENEPDAGVRVEVAIPVSEPTS